MFQSLLAEFVSRQVVSLVVGNDGSLMSMDRKIVQFCCPGVFALWHGVLLNSAPN
jgi:hypothetical protein